MVASLPISIGFQLGGGIRQIVPSILLAMLLGTLTWFAVTTVLLRRFPQPWINGELSQVRVGRVVLPWSDLDWAKIRVATPTKKQRSVGLVIGAGPRARLVFVLRSANGAVLDRDTRTALAQIVAASSITMPRSSNDPTGRFAHLNFPENISKEEALRLIEDPPGPDESLPIPS
jgi:hypothetical protein